MTSSPNRQPAYVEAYFATAEMALDKEDYALAAETLAQGPQRQPHSTRGFTTCWPEPWRAKTERAPARRSPRPSRSTPDMPTACCSVADQLIDGERYSEADKILKQVLDVNPHEPRAFAYRGRARAPEERPGR